MPKIVAIGATSVVDVLDGNSVVETIVEYAVSLDGKNPPGNPMMDGSETITDMNGVVLTDGTWSTEIPTIPEGQWLWTRTRTFYSDGQFTIVYTVSRSGNNGAQGTPGVGYSSQKEQWYLSSSPIKLEGGSWSDNEPSEIPDGKYLWGRIEYTMSDGSTRYSDAIYRSMISGLISKADEVEKKIEQKIWASDIQTSIDSYDGSIGKSIKDTVVQTEATIGGINTTIKNIQSDVSKKADGTEVTNLSKQVNTISDTVDKHTQTISRNTSRLDNAEAEITSTKTIANQTADKFTWLVQSGDSASNFTLTSRVAELVTPQVVIKDPAGNSTVITGGNIQANTITAAMLATDAIKSSNYSQSENPNTSPYSGSGTFLDLATGNFWTPNFGVIQVTPSGTNVPLGAWFNGTVYATAGRFGDGSAYFDIETFKDFNQNKYAGLVAYGNAYIETGNWQVSNNSVATRKYITTTESAGQLTYYQNPETGIYYDVGMKIPTNFSSAVKNEAAYSIYNKSFFYGRKSKSNYIPIDDDGWDYLFQIDHDGNIYEQGQPLNARYAAIGDVEGQYVSTTGGTVNGNLTVTGTLTATASNATKVGHSLSINNKSFDGQETVDVGTIGVAYGGTGATSFTSGAVLIGNGSNAIQTRSIKNNVKAGPLGWTSATNSTELTTVNTIAYWNGAYTGTSSNLEYAKQGKLGTIVTHDAGDFISASGGTIDGNLTVTGTASFTGELNGDLTGDITGGSTKVYDSGNGTATTFAYSKSGLTANWTATPWFAAWNGYELRAISAANVKTTLGLNNVENTADANKNVLSATKFTSAQSVTLTGDTTGTASSQAGWSIATTTKKLTNIGRLTSANVDNSDARYSGKLSYFLAPSTMTEGKPPADAGVLNFGWDFHNYGAQIAIKMNATPHLYLRGNNNVSWDTNWLTVLDSNNYNTYAPTLTGTGATGTWGISITGNAATATKLTGNVGSSSVPVYINNGVPTTINYLNIQSENNPITIPFLNNDLAFLTKRSGGAYEIYSTTATTFTGMTINKTPLSIDLSNAFNGSYNYCSLNRPQDETTVIDITCPEKYTYTNTFYIDFGATSWRAKNIELLVYNSATETAYVSKGSITNNTYGHWSKNISHSSTSSGGTTVQGFDRIRIVLSGWNNVQNRIAQIGIVNFASLGMRMPYMSRGENDPVYRSISPATTDTYNLGSSSAKWRDIHAATFNGALSGNASSATKLQTARNLTIGGTTKSVDWSGAVSFTVSEISGTASQTTNGWMSSADKIKLDSITVSDIGTVGANSIIGEKDINVSITDGIATVGHANTAVTPGTISGTSNSGNLAFGATVSIPSITYDTYGHITGTTTTTFKLPNAPTSVTGNAGTATKFSTARTIELTGDVTGEVSSDGTNGWSIVTTVADDSHNHTAETIVPIQTKTYTDVIATADNEANGIFVYATVRPPTFTDQWHIKYKMRAYVPNQPNYNQYSVIDLYGYKDTINYHIFNTVSSSLCYHNHQVYKLKEAGYNNGYGHAIATRIWSSSNPTNSSYARTFEFELLEEDNCTVTFLDDMTLYSDISGTGTTNYNGRTEYSYGNGLQETGDANDLNDRQPYFCGKTGTKGIWQSSFFMETGDGTYENICTAADGTVTPSNRTTATTKKANTTGFKVGSTIYYTNTSYNPNTNISGYAAVFNSYDIIDSRLSINSTLTANFLTPYKPMYLVGTIGSDGLFYLDEVWWTQTPTTAGKVYVLWGGCYDSSTSYCRITLYQHNPWFYHDGTRLVAYSDYVALADKANKDGNGNVIYTTYAHVSGQRFTGLVGFANSTWNPVGDDARFGDINKAGHIGIQGINGNTGIFFTTYNQDTKTVGGAITWDGTKFSITGTVKTNISGNADTATSATTATNANFLTNYTVDATTINNTAGTFSFAGNGDPWEGLDWVGFQVGSNVDKWQVVANNSNLMWRQNDSGGSNDANWTAWRKLLSSSNYMNYAVPKTGGEFTGAVTGTSFAVTSYLSVNSGNSATDGGLALYSTKPMQYGIAMRRTDSQVTHGHVQGAWATYFNMNGTTGNDISTRGWIFRNNPDNIGVASISGSGNAAFNGEVSIGTSGTNIDGSCSLVMNRDLGCLDFVFN